MAVRHAAERSLGRWHDPVTASQRDDLVQEALVQTWRYSKGSRVRSLPGLAWTIAQRLRVRALQRDRRIAMESLEDLQLADRVGEPQCFGVAGRAMTKRELWPLVDRGLAGCPGLNATLVMDHYHGIGTEQLAAQHGLTRNGVKRRLYRERRRLRRVVITELALRRLARSPVPRSPEGFPLGGHAGAGIEGGPSAPSR